MPCTITGSPEGDLALLAQEAREETEARCVQLTQMLCGACKALEDVHFGNLISDIDGLADWWDAHQEIDAKAAC